MHTHTLNPTHHGARLLRRAGSTLAFLVVVSLGLADRTSIPSGPSPARADAPALGILDVDLNANSLAVDAAGNVYIGDVPNHVVWKVSPDGSEATVVIGDGTPGVPAAGPAASTAIVNPSGLAVAPDGTLFVADAGSSAILAVREGIVSVVAGQPDSPNVLTSMPPKPGPATESHLLLPKGLALDADGNLYTALSHFATVVKVSPLGELSVVAGAPTLIGRPTAGAPATRSLLYLPSDVAVDATGHLHIADSLNYVVSKIDAEEKLEIVAGNGEKGQSEAGYPAIWTSLGSITGLAFGPHGDLYLADPGNHLVLRIDHEGVMYVVAGSGERGAPSSGPATESPLGAPQSVAVDGSGNVYIADGENQMVLKVDAAGVLSVFAGSGRRSEPAMPTIVNLPDAPQAGASFVALVDTFSDGTVSVASSTLDVCTTLDPDEEGNTPVVFLTAGTCTLTASVGEGSSWLAATGLPQSVEVTSDGVLSGQTARRQVIATLEASLTGIKKNDRWVLRAIKDLRKSLDPKNWADEETPVARRSHKVFTRNQKAAKALDKIKDPPASVRFAIAELLRLDRLLAEEAVERAVAAGGASKRIAQAQKALAKAADLVAKGKPDRAIGAYRKAWREASRA